MIVERPQRRGLGSLISVVLVLIVSFLVLTVLVVNSRTTEDFNEEAEPLSPIEKENELVDPITEPEPELVEKSYLSEHETIYDPTNDQKFESEQQPDSQPPEVSEPVTNTVESDALEEKQVKEPDNGEDVVRDPADQIPMPDTPVENTQTEEIEALKLRLSPAQLEWRKGLFGALIPFSEEEECQIPELEEQEHPNFKKKTFPTCEAFHTVTQFSFLDKNTGSLLIDCPEGEEATFVEFEHYGNETDTDPLFPAFLEGKMTNGERRVYRAGEEHFVKTEYVLAQCPSKGENLHVRVIPKETSSVPEEKPGGPSGLHGIEGLDEVKPEKKLNVMVLLMDALSRRHFMRTFPKTIQVLENSVRDEVSGVFQYLKYLAVHCCTPGNQTPLFSSFQGGEGVQWLKCAEDRKSKAWLWNHYKEQGYMTMWAKGMCWHSYQPLFQVHPNVDHEMVKPFCHPHHHTEGYSNHRQCVTGRDVHSYVFDYTQQFFDAYENKPKFAVSTLMTPHEVTMQVVQTVDDELSEFVKKLIDREDTVVVLTSDHGIGFSQYAHTDVGSYEKAMPLWLMSVPRTFLDANPSVEKNLKENQDRLLTPYDAHATLRELATYPMKPQDLGTVKKLTSIDALRACSDAIETKGQSMADPSFYKPYTPSSFNAVSMISSVSSKERTCEEANIPGEFCVCRPSKVLKADELSNDDVGTYTNLVSEVAIANTMMPALDLEKCTELKFDAIESVKKQRISKSYFTQNNKENVEIKFTTREPSAAWTAAMEKTDDKWDVKFIMRDSQIESKCGMETKEKEHWCVCK